MRKKRKIDDEDINMNLDDESLDEFEEDFYDEFMDDDDDLDDDPNSSEAERKKNLKKEFYVKRSRSKRGTEKISGIEEE